MSSVLLQMLGLFWPALNLVSSRAFVVTTQEVLVK